MSLTQQLDQPQDPSCEHMALRRLHIRRVISQPCPHVLEHFRVVVFGVVDGDLLELNLYVTIAIGEQQDTKPTRA